MAGLGAHRVGQVVRRAGCMGCSLGCMGPRVAANLVEDPLLPMDCTCCTIRRWLGLSGVDSQVIPGGGWTPIAQNHRFSSATSLVSQARLFFLFGGMVALPATPPNRKRVWPARLPLPQFTCWRQLQCIPVAPGVPGYTHNSSTQNTHMRAFTIFLFLMGSLSIQAGRQRCVHIA